jgi:ABC-type bacteriocin/lantibiotic exporter with double-glycine peptidase domain
MALVENKFVLTRHLLEMVRGERVSLVSMSLLSLVIAFTEGLGITILLPLLDPSQRLTIPIFSGILNYLRDLDITSRLYLISAILAGLLVFRSSATFLSQHLEMVVPSRISRRLSLRLHEAYLSANLEFSNRLAPGEIYALLAIAPERAVKVLKGVLRIIVMIPLVLVSVAVMMSMSWPIATFAILTFGCLYSGVRALLTSRSAQVGRQLSAVDKALSQSIFDSAKMLIPVKLMNAQRYMSKLVDYRYQSYIESRIRHNKINAAINPLISIGSGLAMVSILLGVATLSEQPEREIPRLLILVIAMARLPGPIAAIGAARVQILTNRHAFDEINTFLQSANECRELGALLPPNPIETIRFSNVSFSYPLSKSRAVEKLNFSVSRGEFVAIVGPSGSGKSTLLNLLAGFYTPTGGNIALDQLNLGSVDMKAWRSQIGIVTQEMAIFNGSIHENIAFQRPDIDREAVHDASRKAGLAAFIDALPRGYDTEIGDGERSLSGGQKQRLMIARALAGRPQVLVFDEATASLDAESESVVEATIRQLREQVTIIWISHRMHTVKGADQILVMDNGRLVATGDHRILLSSSDLYRSLFREEDAELNSDSPTSSIL